MTSVAPNRFPPATVEILRVPYGEEFQLEHSALVIGVQHDHDVAVLTVLRRPGAA
jgi:hypothetical protein